MALMRADALVSSLSEIAVHAKNLETGRKSSRPQMRVEVCCAWGGLTMQMTIIVDVVHSQKVWFRFPATGANRAAVGRVNLVPNFCVPYLVGFSLTRPNLSIPHWIRPKRLVLSLVLFLDGWKIAVTPFCHPLAVTVLALMTVAASVVLRVVLKRMFCVALLAFSETGLHTLNIANYYQSFKLSC
jgi:hypothetical protein